MKNQVVLLTIAVSVAFSAAQIAASTLAPALASIKKSSDPAAQTKLLSAIAPPAATQSAAANAHTFQVNDVKGLLLTCVAPQLDIDPDTDIFNGCTLAPGRTLDDVMHTFIAAIHFVQNEHIKERAEWIKSHEDQSAQKSAQK
jgi:hypothetical protein